MRAGDGSQVRGGESPAHLSRSLQVSPRCSQLRDLYHSRTRPLSFKRLRNRKGALGRRATPSPPLDPALCRHAIQAPHYDNLCALHAGSDRPRAPFGPPGGRLPAPAGAGAHAGGGAPSPPLPGAPGPVLRFPALCGGGWNRREPQRGQVALAVCPRAGAAPPNLNLGRAPTNNLAAFLCCVRGLLSPRAHLFAAPSPGTPLFIPSSVRAGSPRPRPHRCAPHGEEQAGAARRASCQVARRRAGLWLGRRGLHQEPGPAHVWG